MPFVRSGYTYTPRRYSSAPVRPSLRFHRASAPTAPDVTSKKPEGLASTEVLEPFYTRIITISDEETPLIPAVEVANTQIIIKSASRGTLEELTKAFRDSDKTPEDAESVETFVKILEAKCQELKTNEEELGKNQMIENEASTLDDDDHSTWPSHYVRFRTLPTRYCLRIKFKSYIVDDSEFMEGSHVRPPAQPQVYVYDNHDDLLQHRYLVSADKAARDLTSAYSIFVLHTLLSNGEDVSKCICSKFGLPEEDEPQLMFRPGVNICLAGAETCWCPSKWRYELDFSVLRSSEADGWLERPLEYREGTEREPRWVVVDRTHVEFEGVFCQLLATGVKDAVKRVFDKTVRRA